MFSSLPIAFLGNLGTTEILIFGLILVFLFGSAKLPSLMRNLGRSATEFKKGMRDDVDDPTDSRKEDTANT